MVQGSSLPLSPPPTHAYTAEENFALCEKKKNEKGGYRKKCTCMLVAAQCPPLQAETGWHRNAPRGCVGPVQNMTSFQPMRLHLVPLLHRVSARRLVRLTVPRFVASVHLLPYGRQLPHSINELFSGGGERPSAALTRARQEVCTQTGSSVAVGWRTRTPSKSSRRRRRS